MKIVILNYKQGNLRSLKNFFESLNFIVKISDKKKDNQKADILILPGVGGFPSAMTHITKLNLTSLIKEHIKKKKILIGICLGMHLLFEYSKEFKKTKGLGLIKGNVENLKKISFKNKFEKIPHITWKKIFYVKKNIFKINKNFFYFCHSYFCQPKNLNNIIYYSNFNGFKFPVIIKNKNIIGIQFHPEKSSVNGKNLIKNIMELYEKNIIDN